MNPTENTPDTEIILTSGDLRLRVSPFGASLRGLWRETTEVRQDIATGYEGAKSKMGGQGDVLIPFPGRVGGGAYTWEGKSYQMATGDKDGPNAIHGFLRGLLWETSEQSGSHVAFAVNLDPYANPGYPFALRASVRYELTESGMTCRFSVQNAGSETAPVGAGFHPYFTVGSDFIDSDTLHVPFSATLEMETLIPTGRVLPVDGTSLDFRTPRRIDQTVFNTCYAQPTPDADGKTRVRLQNPDKTRTVTVWMDEAFGYVVLYSGDPLPATHRRKSLAIEPMTCGSDAFNHPEWGLVALAPGQHFGGAWGVDAK